MDTAKNKVSEKLNDAILFDLEELVPVFAPDLIKLKKTEDSIRIKDQEYAAKYYANPGETNARLAELFSEGLPKGKAFLSDELPEQMADFLAQSRPDVFEKIAFTPSGQYVPVYQGLKLKEDITGPELRKLGSPSDLRFLVRKTLDPDRGQINRMYRPGPINKAMGGPVVGLDVYFNQMRMM